jgi:hypothetical protein
MLRILVFCGLSHDPGSDLAEVLRLVMFAGLLRCSTLAACHFASPWDRFRRPTLFLLRQADSSTSRLSSLEGLHALVRFIRRFRPRWLVGIRLVRRLGEWWPFGAFRFRRCSWTGQRRFGKFVCIGGRVAEHNMAPRKMKRAASIRIPSWTPTNSSRTRYLQRWCSLRRWRDVQDCSVLKIVLVRVREGLAPWECTGQN